VLQRVLFARGEHFRERSRDLADIVLTPAVSRVRWSEFSRARECFDAGVAVTRDSLDAMRESSRRARQRTFLRRLRPARALVTERAEQSGRPGQSPTRGSHDPDVHDSRIRLLSSWVRFAARRELEWTAMAAGSKWRSSSR